MAFHTGYCPAGGGVGVGLGVGLGVGAGPGVGVGVGVGLGDGEVPMAVQGWPLPLGPLKVAGFCPWVHQLAL